MLREDAELGLKLRNTGRAVLVSVGSESETTRKH